MPQGRAPEPCRGCTARLSGGRDGVAAGQEACQRAARVLRDATALSGDTPPAPRLGWQLWALRPGLDEGVPAVHDELLGRSERPGFERAADQKPPSPGGAGAQSAVDHGIRRCGVTYAVSSGVSFGCRQGVSFEWRLTAAPGEVSKH